jgi:dipeptidyl-peptidase III
MHGLDDDQVLSNLVNYKSFGFTKIVPRVPEDKFGAVVKCSYHADKALVLWNKVSSRLSCVDDELNRSLSS